jgi:uncharacterized SAM-binding protein YcdF (DUF218 family)
VIEWLVIPAGAAASWVGAAAALDVYGRLAAPRGDGAYDAMVVAGCRVFPDGRPSAALARRVGVAAALFQQGAAPRIVLTGGPSVGAPISEARAAAALCERLGVPARHLVLEEASTTTLENAAFAARLIPDARAVLVVSDCAHLFRCRRMFGRHFARVDVAGSVPPRRARAQLALREVGAIVRHGLAGRL